MNVKEIVLKASEKNQAYFTPAGREILSKWKAKRPGNQKEETSNA